MMANLAGLIGFDAGAWVEPYASSPQTPLPDPLDSLVAIALVVLCVHVGVLLVALARGLVPQRRHPDRVMALAAGGAALAGELLALRGLLGDPAPLVWVGGLLGLGLLLGILARGAWREHPVGRAAFHATIAPLFVFVFVAVLMLRAG